MSVPVLVVVPNVRQSGLLFMLDSARIDTASPSFSGISVLVLAVVPNAKLP